MKGFVLIAFSVLIQAHDIEELEELKVSYNKCQKELSVRNIMQMFEEKECGSKIIKKLQKENALLKKDAKKKLEAYRSLLHKERILNARLKKELNKPIKKENIDNDIKKVLKTKDFEINNLKNKTSKSEEKIVKIKASTYHFIKTSKIYESINGKVIYTWKNGTPFTSDTKTQNWIKVGGYFVNEKWKKAEKSLWIKLINTKKR